MHDAKNAQSALAQQIAQTIADEIVPSPPRYAPPSACSTRAPAFRSSRRYRKEVTGGLDDTQLRNLETRLTYLRELEDRRAAVLASIGEQGKLSDELRNDILAADTRAGWKTCTCLTSPSDVPAPRSPARPSEPLADGLLADPTQDPQTFAATFVDTDKGVADTKAALEGARRS